LRERCRYSSAKRYGTCDPSRRYIEHDWYATGENTGKEITPEDHLEAAIQSIVEAVESITTSTDLAFSGAMDSRATYHNYLRVGVGQG
jgi:hypothetical protein